MGTVALDHGKDALDFVDSLAGIDSVERLLDSFYAAAIRFGFQTFIMTGLPHPSQRFEKLIFLKRWPEEWYRIYARERFIFDDPVAIRCRTTVEPFEWAEAAYDPDKQPRAHRIMRDAVAFQMAHGFCVPIHGLSGFEAAVSLGGDNPDLDVRSKASLHLMAVYAFNRARNLHSPLPVQHQPLLSPRERDVIAWAAAGKSTWEVSCILGIAESTVEKHVAAAVRKLGAANKVQAVAEALRAGEIPL